MTFQPTEEQQLITTAAKDSTDNLIVMALAGAAKTSTLVLIAEALPKISILCLSFNKRIATEMTERLPMNCQAMTLNSLGHRTWAQFTGKRLILEKDKDYSNLKREIDKLQGDEKKFAFENFNEILQAIGAGKTCGYIPTGHFQNAKRLMDDDEFFAWMDEAPTILMEKLIRACSIASIEQGLKGIIDFNDQILLPTVYRAQYPQYPLVMVDEAQDLSALNHATLRLLARKRIIAVGDECQAIYGFRGAHEDSMNLLKETFSMRPLILSISFRCPRSVITEAQWRAPHMRAPEWAVDGAVTSLTRWDKSTIPDTAAIVCRNNAPLFGCAIKLLKNGRYPQLIGNDIGKYLVKVMKKFGKGDLPRDQVLGEIQVWIEDKLKKSRNAAKIYDQAACMRIFAEQGDDLSSAIAYAEHLFNTQGPIQLMTIHKAKGLEFDHVYILDRELIRVDKETQEQNLLYVAQTRAKKSLTYISSKNFLDELTEEAA